MNRHNFLLLWNQTERRKGRDYACHFSSSGLFWLLIATQLSAWHLDTLPNKFVLKATHGSGYNYICKDKQAIDYQALEFTVNGWLSENFSALGCEPQYKHCRPRIICEKYIEDATGSLRDYKFFCANGKPRAIQVDADRFIGHKRHLLNVNLVKLPYRLMYPEIDSPIEKPANLPKMISLAKRLSKDFPFVRVDLYSVDERVYFGELTFTPGSGLEKFTPATGDAEFGKFIDLTKYTQAATGSNPG